MFVYVRSRALVESLKLYKCYLLANGWSAVDCCRGWSFLVEVVVVVIFVALWKNYERFQWFDRQENSVVWVIAGDYG